MKGTAAFPLKAGPVRDMQHMLECYSHHRLSERDLEGRVQHLSHAERGHVIPQGMVQEGPAGGQLHQLAGQQASAAPPQLVSVQAAGACPGRLPPACRPAQPEPLHECPAELAFQVVEPAAERC